MKRRDTIDVLVWSLLLAAFLALSGCSQDQDAPTAAPDQVGDNTTVELGDAEIENIVLRSYPFVTMYNVNN